MNQSKAFRIVCACFVVVFLFASIFPFLWILITSFKPEVEIHGNGAYNIIANNPTLENYITVIFDKHILTAVKNSFITAATTTIYVVIVASMSAFIIARFRFKGKSLLMGLILSISMFPQMIVIGPIFNMFYDLGWLNTYNISLAYCTITLPSAVWIMVTHFKQVPLSLEEAAKIDGCNYWGILWKIIFPIAAPGVFATAIITFIAAWNEYLLSCTLNIAESMQSVPVRISYLRDEYTIFWGQITAAAIVVIIPTLIMVLVFQKQIVAGISHGAVKE
ncbi:MAG TPA: carbohydrate ABC transporter permease [Candidatus Enterocloster excrementipullorum]|uniref:Carbohydrate ABC transporter permease n=1 Tax=Candidatus Enterocloster excrementipullorum TaxID=2838559 RepID=A0A9D2MWV5_9FIRM|nr:carbohydrate ABC transporter permease [Candidatus Enterocloster excrementipullorum]